MQQLLFSAMYVKNYFAISKNQLLHIGKQFPNKQLTYS